MGIDIHVYLEKRAHKDAPWESADIFDHKGEMIDVFPGRSSDLFSLLGARGALDTVFEEKGLPPDMAIEHVSLKPELDWACFGFSWLTLGEVCGYQVPKKMIRFLGYDPLQSFSHILVQRFIMAFDLTLASKETKIDDFKQHMDDFRCIYFFDT